MTLPAVEPRTPAAEQAESRFLLPPIVLAVVALWVIPLRTSLTLDETGNYWVLGGGFAQIYARTKLWLGGPSLIYNYLVQVFRAAGGDSDIVLRLPSVLLMIAALALLYRVGLKFMGPLASMCACLVFVVTPEVVMQASMLRPYSLGMVFLLGAMLALVNWTATGRSRHGIAYAFLAALTVYAHFMFGLMYVVHLAYYWFHRTGAVKFRALLAAWAAGAVLMLPLADQIMDMLATGKVHNYLSPPGFDVLLAGLVPSVLAGAIGAAILYSILSGKPLAVSARAPAGITRFLAVWAAVPPLILFAVSLISGITVFIERYYLQSAPALALLAGAVLGSLETPVVRRTVAGCLAVVSILALGVQDGFTRGAADWRGAIQAIREHPAGRDVPVLEVATFVEATTVEAIQDPRFAEVLFAPAYRYRLPGLVRLPAALTPESEAYVERLLAAGLEQKDEFMVFGVWTTQFYESYLRGRLLHTHTGRTLGQYSGVKVVLFERNGAVRNRAPAP